MTTPTSFRTAHRALRVVVLTSLWLLGCTDEPAPAGPVTTGAEAVAVAQRVLTSEEIMLGGPAAQFDPESGRVEEERPDGWRVSFGGFGEVDGHEVRFEVLVDKATGTLSFLGMPEVSL